MTTSSFIKFLSICSLTGVFFLSGCGVSSTGDVMSREANSGGAFGLGKAEKIKASGLEALENTSDLVIGSFKVGFVESAKQTNQARGGVLSGASYGGKAKGNFKLSGISDADKQAITEAAYRDFVETLRAKGYTVKNRSTLTSSPAYAGLSKESFPLVADSSGFLSAYGKTVFYQPQSFGRSGILFMNDLPAQSGGSGLLPGLAGVKSSMAFQTDSKVAQFAEQHNLGVVSVTYVVDFAAAGGHSGISSASIVVGQNLAVTQASMKIITRGSSTFTAGTADVSLGQPIESGKKFGEVVNETSGGDIAIQEAANVAGLLVGQGTNRSRDYIVEAIPSDYKMFSTEVLKQANQALASSVRK